MRTTAVLTVCIGVAIWVGAGGRKTAVSEIPKPPSSWVEVKQEKKEKTCNKWKIVKGIQHYRASTWMWQWQEGSSFERFTRWRPKHSCEFLTYLAVSARKKARQARISFNEWFKGVYAKWECIHGHEGAWNAATENGFYGGLQMDLGFQKTHGWTRFKLWGTADNWPVWAQLRAAEDAYYSGRGFHPWPNTARYCGLL